MKYSRKLTRLQRSKLENLKIRNVKFWEIRKARLEALAEDPDVGRVLDFRTRKVLDEGEPVKLRRIK